jgi:6-phosphogluconate dehydrogenase
MNTGFIGLGKMGFNMVENLLDHQRKVVVFDLSVEAVEAASEKGAIAAESPGILAGKLQHPRMIWIMVPAGKPVDSVLELIMPHLEPGDILIDGGNSRYSDSERRAKLLEQQGIFFLDAGTSGGLDGARHGACIMVGGAKEAYDLVEPLLRDMCVKNGYGYMGRSGSGHFVKMVHNGIEYGMMQAIGEGFDLLETSGYDLDPEVVAGVWANGSVIRGWLMELAGQAFSKDRKLGYLKGEIADSGEGRWTVEAALEQKVSIPVIAGALFRRYSSRAEENFSDKVVAALRHEFGGHGFKADQ